MTKRLPTLVLLAAGIGPCVAAPIVTYAIMGDQSEVGVGRLDYAVRPLNIASTTVSTIALISTVLAVVGLAVLIPRWRDGSLHLGWKKVLICLVAAGVLLGVFARVATAGVIGANIGFGLMIFTVGPICLVLLIGAVLTAIRTLRTPTKAAVLTPVAP